MSNVMACIVVMLRQNVGACVVVMSCQNVGACEVGLTIAAKLTIMIDYQ